MSREYGLICDECHQQEVRIGYIADGIELEQCLSCGTLFKITTTREKLTSKGISEEVWKKAIKEALQKKAVGKR